MRQPCCALSRGDELSNLVEIRRLEVDLLQHDFFAGILTPRPRLNLLSDINLTLASGQTLGIAGESGSGKTTLARALMGLQAITGGEISFDGEPLSKTRLGKLRKNAAMMFQDATASLSPRMTVGNAVVEPLIIGGSHPSNSTDAARKLLERVGLPATLINRYPHELSGGQARRVCLARALSLTPKFLVADEPTAGLDVSVQGEVLNLMSDLQKSLGLSVMIISHNLAMLRHVSDRIAILYLGRLVETGNTRQVLKSPLHPYTKGLIASEPQPDPRKRRADLAIKGEIPSIIKRPAGCVFHTRCTFTQERCRREVPELRTISDDRQVRCHFAEDFNKKQGDENAMVH